MNTTININPLEKLSKREKQILDLMLSGLLIKDIGSALGLKSNTISTFKKSILIKTGTKNIIELFQLANNLKK